VQYDSNKKTNMAAVKNRDKTTKINCHLKGKLFFFLKYNVNAKINPTHKQNKRNQVGYANEKFNLIL
jgi:hypothetical protein